MPGGARPTSSTLALFAHFDPEGIVDDYVVNAVSALADQDIDVVLITSSTTPALARIEPYCTSIITKTNAGRDFGSWYVGTKAYLGELEKYQSVIWMNDLRIFRCLIFEKCLV